MTTFSRMSNEKLPSEEEKIISAFIPRDRGEGDKRKQ